MTILVIVESPAKRKTIQKYLGPGYEVQASVGHIRDLPAKKEQIPKSHQDVPWARLGINVDEDFAPLYIISPGKEKVVKDLRDKAKTASQVILATDGDREGEAIGFHLSEALKLKNPDRITFNEITQDAIKKAIANPRKLDRNLVHAQETRRILDRLYGYEVSPVLWDKIASGLSAGRVQSVATRMVVERERARMAFMSGTYHGTEITVQAESAFTAKLLSLAGQRLATGKDFDAGTGQLRDPAVLLLSAAQASVLSGELQGGNVTVTRLETRPFEQAPPAPFITTTLAREANRRYKWSVKKTAQVAQGLYEAGIITYIRTDSPALSEDGIAAARATATELYGENSIPSNPAGRKYASKNADAQEAHEAIRPAGKTFKTPTELAATLDDDGQKLYKLIWERTMASQMINASGERVSVTLSVNTSLGQADFSASGRTIHEPGFMRAYVEGSDDPDSELGDKDTTLPALAENQALPVTAVRGTRSETKPPGRFDESSLVAELESKGIGRPSTYASIMSVIQDKGYVRAEKNKLIPTWTGHAVTSLLEAEMGRLVDYTFTAQMETALDLIAEGKAAKLGYLKDFYRGDEGLHDLTRRVRKDRSNPRVIIPQLPGAELFMGPSGPYLKHGEQNLAVNGEAHELKQSDLDAAIASPQVVTVNHSKGRAGGGTELGVDPESGQTVTLISGRFGMYVQLGEGKEAPKATVPDLKDGEALSLTDALELITQKKKGVQGKLIGMDPEGVPVTVRTGQYGTYLQLGSGETARRSNVPESEDIHTLSLERALMFLSFNRVIGTHGGMEIKTGLGKHGPYIRVGDRYHGITHEQGASLTLEEAVAIHTSAAPRTTRDNRTGASVRDNKPRGKNK